MKLTPAQIKTLILAQAKKAFPEHKNGANLRMRNRMVEMGLLDKYYSITAKGLRVLHELNLIAGQPKRTSPLAVRPYKLIYTGAAAPLARVTTPTFPVMQ